MTTTTRGADVLIAVAALSGAVAVGLGAYGAHGIDEAPEILRIWETGVQYHMWHALGAIAAAWVASRRVGLGQRLGLAAGWMFLAGTVLFSGTLYYFVLGATIPVTGAAPLGGVMMIIGWLLIAAAALKRD